MGSFVTRSLVALGAGAALVLVPASTAYAEPVPNPLVPGDDEQAILSLPGLPEYDSQFNWSRWVEEIDYEDGECLKSTVNAQTFTMPAFPGQFEDWLVTIVKSVGDGTTPATNDLTWWPIPGEVFWHSSGQDIAHVIYCSADFSDDDGVVPPPPVTTTTTTPTTTPTATPTTTATTPPVQDYITRFAGSNRYDTARMVSASHFNPGVPVVYLTTGEHFPDALAVGALAGARQGPVLLTRPSSLPIETAEELERLQPQSIVILGQTDRVSAGVEQGLVNAGYGPVTRIAGANRYETAALISQQVQPTAGQAGRVYLATGLNFPDSLAAAAIAARDGDPLLLTGPTLHPATLAELLRLDPSEVVILGSVPTVTAEVEDAVGAALPSATVTRVGGSDRFATAAMLSALNFPANAGGTVYVSTGANFPDALAVGPVAGLKGAPVLLVPPTGLVPQVVLDEVARLAPDNIVILGTTASVSAEAEAQLTR